MNDTFEVARKWLLAHGYEQWRDGVWHDGGHEADAQTVLATYIEERIALSARKQTERADRSNKRTDARATQSIPTPKLPEKDRDL